MAEENAPPPVTIYQMVLSFNPSTSEFLLEAPADRGECYRMLGLAAEKLIFIGLQMELAAQRKRIVGSGN